MSHFQTITHGKCILAGEHAVLIGNSLIAKSINALTLKLTYKESTKPLNFDPSSQCPLSNEVLMHYFYALLDRALKGVGEEMKNATGEFHLSTNLPACSGLGFSAAICLAVCNWLIFCGYLNPAEKFNYCRHLEDLFHGTSSGADIAAIMNSEMIVFKPFQAMELLRPRWQPKLFISITDSISSTADAVAKVKNFRNTRSTLAENTDKKMQVAVDKIIEALNQDEKTGFNMLAEALLLAKDCFKTWDLIPSFLEEEIRFLEKHGAVVVKPTGSGGGGSLLSLWETMPPKQLHKKLIPVL